MPPVDFAAADNTSALFIEPAEVPFAARHGLEHRRQVRFPVQACGSIALQDQEASSATASHWLLADILDISKLGMCLIISGPHIFPQGQHLTLDVGSQPGFGGRRLEVEVRWCRSGSNFTTFGVSFGQLLAAVPRLELEGRSERFDPQDEVWDQE